jgi:hypothetical protein
VRYHLLEGMRIAALHHIEMTGELIALRSMATSVMEFTLGCSHDEIFQVEIVDELVSES